MVRVYNDLSSVAQNAAFELLLTRAEWTTALLDAIGAQTIKITDLGPPNIFRLRTYPRKEIAERATTLLDKLRKPSPDKDAIIAQLRPIVTQPGNAVHGREVFTQTCAICHKLGAIGKEVGPVLDGIGAHGPEALLVRHHRSRAGRSTPVTRYSTSKPATARCRAEFWPRKTTPASSSVRRPATSKFRSPKSSHA